MAFHIMQSWVHGGYYWEVRQEVKWHRAGALMLLQAVPHAVRSPLQEARLCCLASVYGRQATFLMHWKCQFTIAWEGRTVIGIIRPSL